MRSGPLGTTSQRKYASSCVPYGWPLVASSTRSSASSSIPFSVSSKRSYEEAAELHRRDPADLQALRAAPEGLVLVVEDPFEDMALAPEVDVGDVRLLLEHRAHQVRIVAVERHDLLELVENEHGTALALGSDPAGKRKQAFDRVVDGCTLPTTLEDETKAPVDRIDLHDRRDAKAAEEAGRPLHRLPGCGLEVAVDRLRERRGKALLGRCPHQVAVADEDPLPDRALRGTKNEGRLAVPPRRVDEDVLSVLHVPDELADLEVPIGERAIQRKCAEGERVGMRHELMQYCIRYVCKPA